MITQGIIKDINYTEHPTEPYLVYVPILDGDKEYNTKEDIGKSARWCTFLALPGIKVPYAVGDKVILGALNYNPGTLIILGYLGTATQMQLIKTNCEITADKLTSKDTTLTTNTKLGNIDYNALFNLIAAVSTLVPTIPPITSGD